MLFLVLGDNIDPGYLVPPVQQFQIIEQAVVPSFQIMAQWVTAGKAHGGLYPGERGGALVVEAASFEELDSMLNHLPFFGLVKWQVKALVPFASEAVSVTGYIKDARNMMQGGGPPR